MRALLHKLAPFGVSLFLVASSLAQSSPEGSLDPTFGTGGKVRTFPNGGGAQINAVALAPDGKLVVAGSRGGIFLTRYNAGGTLDNSFGGDGEVEMFLDINGNVSPVQRTETIARAVAIQPDGKIVVAGFTTTNNSSQTSQHDFMLARYQIDGSLDTSFHSDGVLVTDFSQQDDEANGIVLQPDGKIVVAGASRSSAISGKIFAVARYDSNGGLDFKTTTAATFDREDIAYAVALRNDGRIVVAGRALRSVNNQNNVEMTVMQFHTDGTFDSGFGKRALDFQGFTDEAYSVAIQDDGKIVLGGIAGRQLAESNGDFALARCHPDGVPDEDFGTGGKVTTSFGGDNQLVQTVVAQSDGRLVAAGYSSGGGNATFALAR